MTTQEFSRRADACAGKLYAVAYLTLRSEADCEDAIQEALLRAWRHIGALRDEALFETWLVRICADEIRVYASIRDTYFHPAKEMASEQQWYDVVCLTAREAMAMGMLPCPCSYAWPADAEDGPEPSILQTAWSSPDTPYYHHLNMCKGEKFSQSDTIAAWKSAKKTACPVCMREKPAADASLLPEGVADTIVFFAPRSAYYHKDFHCDFYGHSEGRPATHTLRAAVVGGLEPCPYCASGS